MKIFPSFAASPAVKPLPPKTEWCKRCRMFQYPGDGAFCGQCGDQLVVWPKCECGHAVTAYKFCTHCGKEYAR